MLKELHDQLNDLLQKERRAEKFGMKRRMILIRFLLKHPNALRLARGNMTQAEFGAIAGVSQAQVSHMERGNTDKVSDDAVLRMLNAYAALES